MATLGAIRDMVSREEGVEAAWFDRSALGKGILTHGTTAIGKRSGRDH